MSKVALFTDAHFGAKKNSELVMNSQIRFVEECFVPYLKENEIDTVFMLGDLFDNRSSINVKVKNEVLRIFRDVLKNFKIHILVGNHDSYFTSTIDVNSIKFLDSLPNVTVVEKITLVEVYGKKVTLVPWIVDQTHFIHEFKKFSADVCFGHFNISGFNFNKYKVSEDGLPSKLFGNKCKKVFSGHFHTRSSQKHYGTEIIYVGSPYQITRHDIDEERGFLILDMETLEHEYVNNQASMKYIVVKYPEKVAKSRIEGNIVDVHIEYNEKYNESNVEKYVQKIESYNPAVPPNIIVTNSDSVNGEFALDGYNIGSMLDLIKDYIDSLEIKNKEEIYQILVDLYNESNGDGKL